MKSLSGVATELDPRTVAPGTLRRLAEGLRRGFDAAAAVAGQERCTVKIAGSRVEVRAAPAALGSLLLEAWRPFRCGAANGKPDLVVFAWTSEPAGLPPPKAPLDLRHRSWRGVLADTDAFAAQLQGPTRILSLLDRSAGEGYWWSPDLAEVPGWERAAPFRQVLHWWAPSRGRVLTHAAAVGLQGEGILLAGKGGSGKSTTALSCLAAGWQYAGDDYVLTSSEEDGPRAHALFATSKVDPSRLSLLFPERSAPPILTEPGGKAIVPIDESSIAPSLRLRALVLPTLDGPRDATVERASAPAAMLALAPSTLFQLPCSGAPAVRHLARIAKGLPVFRLHLSPDLQRNVAGMREIWHASGAARHAETP